VTQSYNTYGDQEDIIRGNSAVLKCKIPSFVADFLEVVSWHDDLGTVYSSHDSNFGMNHNKTSWHKKIGQAGFRVMWLFYCNLDAIISYDSRFK